MAHGRVRLIDIAQDDDLPCLCGRTTASFVGEATRSDEEVYTVVRDEAMCDQEESPESRAAARRDLAEKTTVAMALLPEA